ncbi:MAG: hypothetical protein ACR2N7_05900 [Acidimicrobiia bacterium]
MSVTEKIQDRFTAGIVYGEPSESQGTVVLPAARVLGGGGGGSDQTGGEGAGFGMYAAPAGAWVIRDGKAHWKPAVDPSIIFVGGYAVAISYFFFAWLIARSKGKRG